MPSVSSRFSRAAGSRRATSTTVAPNAAGPFAKTCCARRAEPHVESVLSGTELMRLQHVLTHLPVADPVAHYASRLVLYSKVRRWSRDGDAFGVYIGRRRIGRRRGGHQPRHDDIARDGRR